MANLAIIPARGGSKRIEKKNIKDLFGSPIISYPIRAAIKTKVFDEIIVSTDDDEIANIARHHHAKTPFVRSAVNSNDHAILADVILEIIENYAENGIKFENICCILPTAALIKTEHLISAYKLLVENKYHTVVPIVKYSFPIQRAFYENNGFLKLREPEFINTRSQDLMPSYHDSGQFYWINTHFFTQNKLIFTDNTGFIELDEFEAQDVDTQIDWDMLKLKFQYQKIN